MQTLTINEHFKEQRDLNPKEAIQLLRSYGFRFFSWGAHAFQTINTAKDGYCKALRFKSEGRHHKGHVYISVNGSDLYDVILTSAKTNEIKKEIKDIYFDDLFDVIDKEIEYIDAYKC